MGVIEKVPVLDANFDPLYADRAWASRLSALRDLRRQHAYLLTNLPGVVYRCEAAQPRRMLFISEKVGDLTGHRREKFEAGFQWETIVHPEDFPKLRQTIDEAVEGTREFAAFYRIIHKSGLTKWVSDQAQVVEGEDGKTYVEGFIQDITQQRHLEETVLLAEKASSRKARLLEEVLEGTSDCVYSLDRWWSISYVNTKAEEYFSDGKPLIGTPILELFTDPHSPFEATLRRAMDERERGTVRGFLPSRQSWYELTAAPTPGGITVFFRDTTEQEKLRDQERASADR